MTLTNTLSTWMYPPTNSTPWPYQGGTSVAPPFGSIPTSTIPSSIPSRVVVNDPMPTPFQPMIHFENFAKSLTEQVILNKLPALEPGIFDGDALKYPGWRSTFDTLIDKKGMPPSERLFYLKKYLAGPAKEAVEGYFLIPTDDAYEKAKRLLEERYGDPFVVITAFRDKLDTWPKIQAVMV